jgi:hypothetical protein
VLTTRAAGSAGLSFQAASRRAGRPEGLRYLSTHVSSGLRAYSRMNVLTVGREVHEDEWIA